MSTRLPRHGVMFCVHAANVREWQICVREIERTDVSEKSRELTNANSIMSDVTRSKLAQQPNVVHAHMDITVEFYITAEKVRSLYLAEYPLTA